MTSGPDVEARESSGPKLGRRGRWTLLGVILVLNLPVIHRFTIAAPPAAVATVPFSDDFSSPTSLEENYWATGGHWRLVSNELRSSVVKNSHLWLRTTLPQDITVEVEVRGAGSQSDLQLELFGDGWSSHPSQGSGYVFKLSGQSGAATCSRSGALGSRPSSIRLGPTSKARVVVASTPITEDVSERAHWKIVRRAGRLVWWVNGRRLCDFTDPHPLAGPGHDRLGLMGGGEPVFFDNLRVGPADDASLGVDGEQHAPPPEHSELLSMEAAAWTATLPTAVSREQDEIVVEAARNHPVWSATELPEEGWIELTAWSESPEGDIKFEAWGDGHSHAPSTEPAPYRASGYVFILGGWRNTRSIIAFQDEHGAHVVGRSDFKVVPRQPYTLRVTRRVGRISMSVDGRPFLELAEPPEARKASHRFLGLSGWDTRVHFRDLKVSVSDGQSSDGRAR